MFLEELEKSGKGLALFLNDVVYPELLTRIPVEESVKVILQKIIKDISFVNVTEDEAQVLYRKFIEPVTYRDIDLGTIDPFLYTVVESCQIIWKNSSDELKRAIYHN